MNYRTLDELSVSGKTVLLRADVDVPIKHGIVADDTRLVAFLPTLQHLMAQGARTVIIGHLGRPRGMVAANLSLRPVAERLSELIGQPVHFAVDCIGRAAESAVQTLAPGGVLMLENTRFHPEEEENDSTFAKSLASLADVFVQDAFSVCHRSHASMVGVPHYLDEKAVGRSIEHEIQTLSQILESPNRPFLVIIGGSKIADKIGMIERLLETANMLMIGGAMANTFLAAQDYSVGRSILEQDHIDTARHIMTEAGVVGCRLILPTDVAIGSDLVEGQLLKSVTVENIGPDDMALDIGPRTIETWSRLIATAGNVLWNGPLGAFEIPPFNHGTEAIAKAISDSPAYSVVGGGDTISALANAGLAHGFDYTCTGGGAMLEFLEGNELPALRAISE